MPNRIIKESICYSDDIDRLSWFEEVVFYRLLVRCDDNGRLDARPAFLRSMLFATRQNVDEHHVDAAVDTLAETGLVARYEAAGRPYLYFPKWALHQRVRNVRSKYPAPPDVPLPPSAAACGTLPPESESETISQSESEVESESGGGRAAAFVPPTEEEVRNYCAGRGSGVNPGRFVDFYASKGWKIGREPMWDWKAALRGWERREENRAAPGCGAAERRAREDMARMKVFLAREKEERSES